MHMKWKTGLAFASLICAAGLGGPTLAAPLTCEGLTADQLGLSDVTVKSVSHVAKGEDMPVSHCLVEGMMGEHTDADGNTFAISFEVRLPDDWNGNFVHRFNGGSDGKVVPAFGQLLGGDKSDTALARGYAVVSSDAGHDGTQFPEAGLAGGERFGLNQQARRDYGYAAVAKLDPVARKIVTSFYDSDIGYAYGVGGSNGGRHAMVAAARMPEAFDGLLIGYPGFNLPSAALQTMSDVQHFNGVNGDLRKAYSQEDLNLVSAKIAEACDALDGLEDGLVFDTDGCQEAFDITSLKCEAGQNSACLSDVQVEALQASFSGTFNSAGEQLYSSFPWDTGISSQSWRFWKLESPIPPWDNLPLIATLSASATAQIWTTPPTKVGGSPQDLLEYALAFDFDEDADKIYGTSEEYPESIVELTTPPGFEDPKLEAFNAAGGKMVVFSGVSDPVFSVQDLTDWYNKLAGNNGGDASSFAKLYKIPGMGHGAGGATVDDFDFFSALVNWVEKGEAPGAVVAGVTEGNQEAAALAGKTRKLCAYPEFAHYTGDNPDSADAFTCQK